MSGGFDWNVIFKHIPFLWEGMQVTFLLTFLAILGGILGGTLLALCRLSKFSSLAWFGGSYVNFFRSMPLILVIFWFYFLVPMLLGRPVGSFTLFEAAYYCEIIRAGISSIGQGQVQAAKAIGLTYQQSMRYIVLPQAFRNMVPILLTQGIILFQDTSLVYVVGLKDFLVTADIVANRDNRLIEMYSTVAFVYFVLCLLGSLGVRRLQRKYAL